MSHKIIDSGTAFHFGVGAFAGWFGMDPKAVLLTALLADATWEVIKAGSVVAALEPAHGQSKAQEIMNLLAIMAGAHGGMYAREQWKPEAAVPPAAPPAASSTAAPPVAGLGRSSCTVDPYHQMLSTGRCRYIGPPVQAF